MTKINYYIFQYKRMGSVRITVIQNFLIHYLSLDLYFQLLYFLGPVVRLEVIDYFLAHFSANLSADSLEHKRFGSARFTFI